MQKKSIDNKTRKKSVTNAPENKEHYPDSFCMGAQLVLVMIPSLDLSGSVKLERLVSLPLPYFVALLFHKINNKNETS